MGKTASSSYLNEEKKQFSGKILLFLVFTILIFSLPSVSSLYLTYDDGSRESYKAVDSTNEGAVVKITIERQGEIRGFDYYYQKTSNGNTTKRALLLDSSHSILLNEAFDIGKQSSYDWSYANFTDTVVSAGTYYVGIGSPGTTTVNLGADTTSVNSRSEQSNNYSSAGSYTIDATKNYMIRAFVAYYPTVSNLAVSTASETSVYLTGTCNAYGLDVKGAEYKIDSNTGSFTNIHHPEDGHWNESTEDFNQVVSIASLGGGAHTIFVKCEDDWGYWTDPVASVSLSSDSTAPVTTIALSPSSPNGNNGWYKTNFSFTLSATDSGSGVNKTYYSLSGAQSTGGFIEYSSAVTINSEGTTTISYYSTDNASNTETTESSTVKLDKTSPSAPNIIDFLATFLNSSTEAIAWSSASDTTSGIDYYVLEKQTNSSGFSHLKDTNSLVYSDTGLATDTDYSYRVKAIDKAGNQSDFSTTKGFSIDYNGPTAPSLTELATAINNATVSLSWIPSIDFSGISKYLLSENWTDPATTETKTIAGTETTFDDTANNDGTIHYFSMKAYDNAQDENGNSAPNESAMSNTVGTLIDLTAPQTTPTLLPDNTPDGNNGWFVTERSLQLSASDSYGPGYSSGVKSIIYCVDSTNSCTPTTTVNDNTTQIGLSDGTSYVRYYSTDYAENSETTQSIGPIKIDTSAPTGQTISLDSGATYNTTGTVSANMDYGTDSVSGLDYCVISWILPEIWNNIGLTTSATNSYSDGLQTASYKCFDLAGNESSIVQDDIMVDTTAPVSTITQPTGINTVLNGRIKISGTAFDNASGVKEVKIIVLDNTGTTVEEGIASGTSQWEYYWDARALPNATNYLIKSVAVDNAGWQEPDANVIIFKLDYSTPTIDNIFYTNETEKHTIISGYLDWSNVDYSLSIVDSTDYNGTPVYTSTITTNDNGFFAIDIDVSAWDLSKIYIAKVSGGEKQVSDTELSGMKIYYLTERLTVLETELADINATLSTLSPDGNLQIQIDELNEQIADINAELSTIDQKINDVNSDLHAHVLELQEQITANTDAISELQTRVSDLEKTVNMLNAGNIQFEYDSPTKNLTVFGEAPTTAKCAKIWFYSSSDSYLAHAHVSVSENPNWADYRYTKNTHDWPQEAIKVIVSFYKNSGCYGSSIGTVEDMTEVLLSEDLFGFRDITTSTYVTSYFTDTINVPISFALKPDKARLYEIQYTTNADSEETSWNKLVNCSYYEEGEKTFKQATITLNSTGLKSIKLRAKRCFFSDVIDYTSFKFKINFVDLKDSLTAYTTIVSPTKNNSDMTKPWPVGSITNNVYWTKSGVVSLVSYVGTSTEPARLTCAPYYYASDKKSVALPEFDITNSEGESWVCDTAGEFNTSLWNNTNYKDEQYTKVRVYNDQVGQPNSFDDINIGIDDVAPTISSISPDEQGAMNGNYKWFANISDNLSGIENVTFYLIEKNGYEYCKDENCWTGAGATIWTFVGVPFDTETNKYYYDLNTLAFPDGDYNVAYSATDIAGNTTYKEIDPIIDNTKPIIRTVTVKNTTPIIRGTTIIIDANVTDNLSGVNAVWATITKPDATTEIVFFAKNGNVYTLNYATDSNFVDGNYLVQVDANDNATNNALPKNTDYNLMYYYKVSVSLNSTSITQGDDVTVNGSVLNDNSTTIGDYNVTLTVPTGTVLVPIDVNGNFSFVFNTTGNGTGQYEIRAAATAPNSISTNAVTYLSINAPSQATGGNTGSSGGSGGGGSSGGSSNNGASAENAPSMAITANCIEDPITILTTRNGNLVSGAKITAKINNSIVAETTTDSSGTATMKINEAGTIELTATANGYSSTKTITLIQCIPTENNNSNNNNTPSTGTNNSSNTGNTTNNSRNTNTEGTGTETPNNNAPTGFFGLGNNTPIVGGILLLAIVGIGYFMFVIRKPF